MLGQRLRWSLLVFLVTIGSSGQVQAQKRHTLVVTVTSELPVGPLPLDPQIDFGQFIAQPQVLDPNSIQVWDVTRGKPLLHSLSRDFRYGSRGRVRWVTPGPQHNRFEIRFRSVDRRPPMKPLPVTPLIGVGDMLRYNAGPQPLAMRYPSRLVDLTGDGKLDLVGTMPHKYLPRALPGGIYCYPQVVGKGREFGALVRLRYRDDQGQLRHFYGPYLVCDVTDLNKDGLPDIVYTTTPRTARFQPDRTIHRYVHVFLNTGRRDDGGMPEFRFAFKHKLPTDPEYRWAPVRAVDMDGDGAIDITLGGMYEDTDAGNARPECYFLRNQNLRGWPMRLAPAVKLDALRRCCFYDVDGDGRLDCVGMSANPLSATLYRGFVISWRKNLGGNPPKFGKFRGFPVQNLSFSTFVSAVDTPQLRGLIFNDKRNFGVELLEQPRRGELKFHRRWLTSRSAMLVAGDQASPFPADWDGNGVWDLVVGGGNGWPQIIRNRGTNSAPVFRKPRSILAKGKPIRLFMSQIFPNIHGYGHDMGYPFPSFLDWDADGLPDLLLPNISNRIFWYRNIGTRQQPKFGDRGQIVVDKHPETAARLRATAKLLGSETKKWGRRMLDPNSPFGWRARAGFGDFNGDGLVDMVQADGRTRNRSGYADSYSLYVRYRDKRGRLKLRSGITIKLPDGSPLKCPGGITSQAIPADWDADGRLDLICHFGPSNTSCQPMYVRNIGTKKSPRFDHPRPLKLWGKPLFNLMKHGPYWAVQDVDGDGKLDLLAGCAYGNYAFFRRTAMDAAARPKFKIAKK